MEKRRDRALDAAAALVRGRRVIGIGSPRAPLEANHALRTLVGPACFYDGMSDADHELVGVVLEVARSGLRLGALGDVQGADVVLVLGEDLTNTAPLADLMVRTWNRLRPTAQEQRTHIRSWNDAAVGRAKRHEPSKLWLATPYATKLDEIAAEAWRATPGDIARLALALAHELDPAAPEVPDLSADEGARVARWAGPLRDSRKAVVISGTTGGSATLVRAAARLAAALPRETAVPAGGVGPDGGAGAPGESPRAEVLAAPRESARLILTAPEVDSVGLRMMEARPLSHAIAAVARGEVDVVAMLGNDLYRRAAPLLVDDLVRRAPDLLVLAALEDTVTGHADVVLPVPTFADSTGTYVNNEGRAQRSFAVLPPRDDTQEAWRWLRDLMLRGDVKEVRGWVDDVDVLAALEHDLPQFRGVAAASPPPGWRQDGRRVARQTQRNSGRTALDADRTMWEPAPSQDADAPLAYSLEGLRPCESPAPLLTRVWSPGWNSNNGLHKLQEEVLGPLRGGPSGVRLLDGAHHGGSGGSAGRPQDVPAPPPFAPHPGGELLLVPVHHIFGSDDLSMREPGIAARAPQPYVAANAAAAAALGLADGDPVTLWLPWMDFATTFRMLPSLPDGVAGVPVGLPRVPYIALAGARPYRAAPAGPAAADVGSRVMAWYWSLLTVLGVLIVVMTVAAGLIWYERRLLGLVQDRLGPNRVGPAGLLQVLADTFKILFKEDWVPPFADRAVFIVAPSIVLITALMSFMVVPVYQGVVVADINIGLLFILAMSSLAVYSVVLAGWSSHSKYSLIGGLRAAAQMVSYEVFMGLSLVGVVIMAGSFNLQDIVEGQQGVWYVIPQFVGFVVFVVAALAETRRIPFDLVEAESELVAGYHTEYSGMKFGLFMVGEYVAITLISALITALFFGGWLGPWLPGWLWFLIKTFIFISCFIIARATFPRPRYDQLMALGWKAMLPLSLVNLLVTGAVVVARFQ